ncbi:MAG: peptidoglycan DD-metalloendopeptidase family protein [Gammaproteobacteria bacterium]|nr:peptidoglycan DD-metalloendopeptidase family protein [Gammaproteobacteria bacterium]
MACGYNNTGAGDYPGNTLRLLCALLLLGLSVNICSARFMDEEEQEEKTEQLQRLQKRISQMREVLNQTRDDHDRARNQLRDIEVRISHHTRELKYINARLGQQDRRLQKLFRDRDKYQKDLHIHRRILSRQLQVNYMMGSQAYLKLLLSQDNAAAAGRTISYYDYFNRSRTERIDEAGRVLARVEQVQNDIEHEKQRLVKLRSHSQTRRSELQAASRERGVIVAKLSHELENKSLSLQRMLEDEKQLQKLLQTISELLPDSSDPAQRNQAFAGLRGRLSWPVQGRIKQVFGKNRGSSRVQWNGVIITANPGREVRAVSHGRVAYADWLRGYGLLLIIDHGQGYMSLYGHNQVLFKETGDWVDSNDVIATVGNSGGQDENGLYFEIRFKGKPANPNLWCKKRGS